MKTIIIALLGFECLSCEADNFEAPNNASIGTVHRLEIETSVEPAPTRFSPRYFKLLSFDYSLDGKAYPNLPISAELMWLDFLPRDSSVDVFANLEVTSSDEVKERVTDNLSLRSIRPDSLLCHLVIDIYFDIDKKVWMIWRKDPQIVPKWSSSDELADFRFEPFILDSIDTYLPFISEARTRLTLVTESQSLISWASYYSQAILHGDTLLSQFTSALEQSWRRVPNLANHIETIRTTSESIRSQLTRIPTLSSDSTQTFKVELERSMDDYLREKSSLRDDWVTSLHTTLTVTVDHYSPQFVELPMDQIRASTHFPSPRKAHLGIP